MQYKKANYILLYIANNEAAGIVHEREADDRKRFQKFVDKYEEYKVTHPQILSQSLPKEIAHV